MKFHNPVLFAREQEPLFRLLLLCFPMGERKYRHWPWLTLENLGPLGRQVGVEAVALFPTAKDQWHEVIVSDQVQQRTIAASYKSKTVVRDFFETHHRDNCGFYYGGHGLGDALQQSNAHAIWPIDDFAATMPGRWFSWMLFDACYMASWQTAVALSRNTPLIGACQGAVRGHVTDTAQYMLNQALVREMLCSTGPEFLHRLANSYHTRAPDNGFTVIDTAKTAKLVIPTGEPKTSGFDKTMPQLLDWYSCSTPAARRRFSAAVPWHRPPAKDKFRDKYHGLSYSTTAGEAPAAEGNLRQRR